MGCAGTKSEVPKVGTNRRRLSVGSVEGGENQVADEAVEQSDRGLIKQLDEQNIIEMLENGVEMDGRKFSIGSNTDAGKTSFSNKTTKAIGSDVQPEKQGLGFTCRKGLKPESPNQDSWSILQMQDWSIYGVYDGHGQKGHDVSQFVKENLPKLIIKDQRWKSAELPQLLKDAFAKVQSLVATADRMKKISAQMAGTTATVCVHSHADKKLTLAHVADSTAVLASSKAGGGFAGRGLTRDHKPNLPDERARIEKSGGRVVFDGYANHRVYAKNARYPGLNMSRCLGDLMGHADAGLSAQPEVSDVVLTEQDKCLLLCSDGVWEFIEPQKAVETVMSFQPNMYMKAADTLAKEAWDRWIQEEGGAVVDDITVVLIGLQQSNES